MMRVSFIVCFVCLTLVAGLSSFAPGENLNLENDVLAETNIFRKSNGMGALQMVSELNALAEQHSVAMAKGKVAFGHGGFDNRNALAVRSNKNISRFAENVAFGAATAKDVVVMWKNSAGHRRNMLGHYKYIGIGTAKDKSGRIYYTQVFAG